MALKQINLSLQLKQIDPIFTLPTAMTLTVITYRLHFLIHKVGIRTLLTFFEKELDNTVHVKCVFQYILYSINSLLGRVAHS